jgi:hypothetical protein
MLAMVLFVIPGGFGFAVWRSYRSERLRSEEGQDFQPEGKIRWSEDEPQ